MQHGREIIGLGRVEGHSLGGCFDRIGLFDEAEMGIPQHSESGRINADRFQRTGKARFVTK